MHQLTGNMWPSAWLRCHLLEGPAWKRSSRPPEPHQNIHVFAANAGCKTSKPCNFLVHEAMPKHVTLQRLIAATGRLQLLNWFGRLMKRDSGGYVMTWRWGKGYAIFTDGRWKWLSFIFLCKGLLVVGANWMVTACRPAVKKNWLKALHFYELRRLFLRSSTEMIFMNHHDRSHCRHCRYRQCHSQRHHHQHHGYQYSEQHQQERLPLW